jgi:hypothetical protein
MRQQEAVRSVIQIVRSEDIVDGLNTNLTNHGNLNKC